MRRNLRSLSTEMASGFFIGMGEGEKRIDVAGLALKEGGSKMRKGVSSKGIGFYIGSILLGLFTLYPPQLFGQKILPVIPGRPPGMEIKNNLISANLIDAELSEVLKQVEKGTGIKIKVARELSGQKVNAYLENSDVESALKAILRGHYYVLMFSPDPVSKKKRFLKEVNVEVSIIGSRPSKRKMITIEIPYGSGKGEVGVIRDPLVGPKSFAVDEKGNIYILDTVNNRIQIFSSDGKFLFTIPLKDGMFALDIVVDRNRFIYIINDDGTLHQYNHKGEIINKIRVDESRWLGRGEMHIISNSIYMNTCTRTDICGDFLIAKIANGSLIAPASKELNTPVKEGKYGLSGRRYKALKNKEDESMVMEFIERDGVASKTISIGARTIFGLSPLGEDGQGNVYFATYRGMEPTAEQEEERKLIVEIQKFGPDTEYLETIRTPESKILFWSIRNDIVTRSGSIYAFLPEKDKLRLQIFLSESK